MTHGQMVRRLTALVSQLNSIQGRISALTKEASAAAPKKERARKGKAAPKQSRAKAKAAPRSYIGMQINYGGGSAKVIERKGDGFVAEAVTELQVNGRKRPAGSRITVSTTYVYRQLSKGVIKRTSEQPAPAAQQELDNMQPGPEKDKLVDQALEQANQQGKVA